MGWSIAWCDCTHLSLSFCWGDKFHCLVSEAARREICPSSLYSTVLACSRNSCRCKCQSDPHHYTTMIQQYRDCETTLVHKLFTAGIGKVWPACQIPPVGSVNLACGGSSVLALNSVYVLTKRTKRWAIVFMPSGVYTDSWRWLAVLHALMRRHWLAPLHLTH